MARLNGRYPRYFPAELFITIKEQWRMNVLPGTLKSNGTNPDQLYGVIVGALKDGFVADKLDGAQVPSSGRLQPSPLAFHPTA